MRRCAIILAACLLAACGSTGTGPAFTCPQINRVGEASRLTRFVPGGHDLTDVSFEAVVGKVSGSCSDDSGTIDVQMTAEFVASRGPADKTRKAPFNYFVAIVDPNDNILAREQFDTGIDFPGNQTRNSIKEELEQTIPLPQGRQGSDYRIFIGFVLTPEEVAYNRAHP